MLSQILFSSAGRAGNHGLTLATAATSGLALFLSQRNASASATANQATNSEIAQLKQIVKNLEAEAAELRNSVNANTEVVREALRRANKILEEMQRNNAASRNSNNSDNTNNASSSNSNTASTVNNGNDDNSSTSNYINCDNFSVSDSLNNLYTHFADMDILTLTYVFNIITTLILFNMFCSFLLTVFSNHILDKYGIVSKYPRLNKFFLFRIRYQNYYFKYIIITTAITLLFKLFINIHGLLCL